MMVHKINENEKENKKIEKLNFPSLFRVLVISYYRLLFLYTNPALYNIQNTSRKKKIDKKWARVPLRPHFSQAILFSDVQGIANHL